MGSKSTAVSTALLLSLSFILFTSVSARPQKEIAHAHAHAHNHIAHLNSSDHESVNATAIIPLDAENCPRDAPKMSLCLDLLNDLFNINAGAPPHHGCCSTLFGLMEIQAAMCVCTTLKANILGIPIDMPIKMTLVLNFCNQAIPKGFKCA